MDIEPTDTLKEQIAFTDHQLAILECWAECPSIDEAAVRAGLNRNTYITHLKRMRKKLGVRRTFDVYKHVLERGLLS